MVSVIKWQDHIHAAFPKWHSVAYKVSEISVKWSKISMK